MSNKLDAFVICFSPNHTNTIKNINTFKVFGAQVPTQIKVVCLNDVPEFLVRLGEEDNDITLLDATDESLTCKDDIVSYCIQNATAPVMLYLYNNESVGASFYYSLLNAIKDLSKVTHIDTVVSSVLENLPLMNGDVTESRIGIRSDVTQIYSNDASVKKIEIGKIYRFISIIDYLEFMHFTYRPIAMPYGEYLKRSYSQDEYYPIYEAFQTLFENGVNHYGYVLSYIYFCVLHPEYMTEELKKEIEKITKVIR